MAKSGLYIIGFIILCSFANFIINYTIEKEIDNRSPYYLSFVSIGAISLESRLDCWAKIKKTSTSQELKQDMLALLDCLDIPVKTNQMQLKTNLDATILEYKFSQNRKQFEFTFYSDQKKNESYYILMFSSQNKSDNLERYREITKEFRKDLAWKYHYQYSGEIAQKIDSVSQQKILKVIMENFAARERKIFINGNITSSIGLSPKISNVIPAVTDNDQIYNIQAEIRNDKGGKTLVCIGSPNIK